MPNLNMLQITEKFQLEFGIFDRKRLVGNVWNSKTQTGCWVGIWIVLRSVRIRVILVEQKNE